MASRTCDLVERVHPAHQFDLDALLRYASSHVHTFPRSPSKFSVSQFGHGQSNPTFLLETSSGSSVKRYVLRKKPPGKLLESAHAIEREFQVCYQILNMLTCIYIYISSDVCIVTLKQSPIILVKTCTT
ncbi:probable acyl-CoA dehydrogenase IBR3 [Camellia sinensis]|uniref:probable acyl-CoA dehydrogenase IBR3 n=1 Tax=Camellia sinensis TaxID=4442 RepID=UPI001035C629|nr:probable acyl-CoA dehydrogenase IBR3 [Camellia sinensis]